MGTEKLVNGCGGVDLNHRPLGYEPRRINDSNAFQRLDGAGNDTESLKRHESTVIGPQSDYCSILSASLLGDILKISYGPCTQLRPQSHLATVSAKHR